jgi:hypothetical protein
VAQKGAHHKLTTGFYGPGVGADRIIVGSAPALVPSGRKHPGRFMTLPVRAAGRSGPWASVHRSRFTRSCFGGASVRRRVFGRCYESASTRFSRMLARALQAGAVLPSGARSDSSGNRAARRLGKNSESAECAETAGSARGTVVHAVCSCSLTVTEVGRRRRRGVITFGCG